MDIILKRHRRDKTATVSVPRPLKDRNNQDSSTDVNEEEGERVHHACEEGVSAACAAAVCGIRAAVYLMSLQAEPTAEAPAWRLSSACIAMVLGLLSTACGVFWTVLHGMKTRLYQRGGGRERRRMRIYAIKRLTSFPPSYEESQASAVDTATGLAPPLCSRGASEAADCTRAWEQGFRGQADAGEHSQTRSE